MEINALSEILSFFMKTSKILILIPSYYTLLIYFYVKRNLS